MKAGASIPFHRSNATSGLPDDWPALTLVEAESESIGDSQYSRWKFSTPINPLPRFSRHFVGIVLFVSVAFVVAGSWVLDQMRSGDFLPLKVFSYALLGLFVIGPLVAFFLVLRRQPPEENPLSPPARIPKTAVATLATLACRGSSVGWLWFESGMLCFRGVGFDFRLRRLDFDSTDSAFDALRAGRDVKLHGPQGGSKYCLRLRPGILGQNAFQPNPTIWDSIETEARLWEAAKSTDPPLFPPLRAVPTKRLSLDWRTWVLPCLLMGLILGFAGLILPLAVSPLKAFSGGLLYGLLWGMITSIGELTQWFVDRDIDRAIRRKEEGAGS